MIALVVNNGFIDFLSNDLRVMEFRVYIGLYLMINGGKLQNSGPRRVNICKLKSKTDNNRSFYYSMIWKSEALAINASEFLLIDHKTE